MQIYVFATIGIAFLLCIFLVMITEYLNDYSYLAYTMDLNWDRQYIKEIVFQKTPCVNTEYETLEIGAWTGFMNGCYHFVNKFLI